MQRKPTPVYGKVSAVLLAISQPSHSVAFPLFPLVSPVLAVRIFFFCQNFFPYTHRHLFEGEKGNFQDKRKFMLLILALLNNSRKFYNGSCCARQPYGVTKLTLDYLEVQMLFERKTAMPTLKRSVYIISLHGLFDKIHFIFKYLGGKIRGRRYQILLFCNT